MTVRGQSMEPSFPDGSRAGVKRLAYLLRQPARGEVVVIRSPEDPHRLELKRIIGLPTETVAWHQGRMSINGHALEESYARIPAAPPGDEDVQRVALAPTRYFVAGDHRLYSRDSRHYGAIPRSSILGKVA